MTGNSNHDDHQSETGKNTEKKSGESDAQRQRRCREKKQVLEIHKQNLKQERAAVWQRKCRARKYEEETVNTNSSVDERQSNIETGSQQKNSKETNSQRQWRCRYQRRVFETEIKNLKRENAAERQRQCRMRKRNQVFHNETQSSITSEDNSDKDIEGPTKVEMKRKPSKAENALHQRCREKKRILEIEKHELKREKAAERQRKYWKRKCDEEIAQ
ncbi:axoneme-associated protein mst101(1)-like [Diachasma alloeum]|uniref:axoneme-associated protein mst101(1)-like n=1 Tax=Diachasma alloeum TaxID=454923 RepID=UPI0007382B3C|nr:axoneme-associated protein mst101(1)-like [Diachasma alloeum]